jgi:hypothetical protein
VHPQLLRWELECRVKFFVEATVFRQWHP